MRRRAGGVAGSTSRSRRAADSRARPPSRRRARACASAPARWTMLLKRTRRVTSPRRRASSANDSGSGRSPEMSTSAPSSRFAWRVSAVFTRSAKKPTVPTLATASTIAAISTSSSPARQSRNSIRSASLNVGMRSARRLVADEAAGGERHPARATRREPHVVRDEQQRRAVLAIEAEHEIGDFGAGRVVEVAGGLVGQQQLRLARERARDRDPLLLAAGQLLRIMRAATREADAIEPIGASARASRLPASSSGSITFSSAVSAGSSWNDWNTKPRAAGAAPRARPRPRRKAHAVEPHFADVGRSRPASSPSSVVLPDPDAPTIATDAPGSTSKLTSSRIVSGASPLVTILVSDGCATAAYRSIGRRRIDSTNRRVARDRGLTIAVMSHLRARAWSAAVAALRTLLLLIALRRRWPRMRRQAGCDSRRRRFDFRGLRTGTRQRMGHLLAGASPSNIPPSRSSTRASAATRRPAGARGCPRCSRSISRPSSSSSWAATTACAAATSRATRTISTR